MNPKIGVKILLVYFSLNSIFVDKIIQMKTLLNASSKWNNYNFLFKLIHSASCYSTIHEMPDVARQGLSKHGVSALGNWVNHNLLVSSLFFSLKKRCIHPHINNTHRLLFEQCPVREHWESQAYIDRVYI